MKRNLLYFSLFLLLLSVTALVYNYAVLFLQICYAADQIKVFHELKNEIKVSNDKSEIAKKMDYIQSYYPSGTKQDRNSRLDNMVELYREDIIGNIVEYLKVKFNEDHGRNSAVWIARLRGTKKALGADLNLEHKDGVERGKTR